MSMHSGCTPGQMTAITTLDAPLIVSAGAGSGKTFTLTQRIAGALDSGYIDDVSQICAITYTRKAAGELRSRIRVRLASMGLLDAARGVDDAWVTTIHGMAARILREHALEIGIDPAFEVLGEEDADLLERRAVDEVAERIDAEGSTSLPVLLRSEPLFATGPFGHGLLDDARAVLARAHAMPQGLEGIVVPRPSANATDILADLVASAETALTEIEGWQRRGKTDDTAQAALQDALRKWRCWRESNPITDILDESFDVDTFRDVLYAFPPTTAKYRVGKEGEEAFVAYRADYAAAIQHAESAIGAVRALGVVRLAHLIEERFSQIKGPSRLDNDDLLRLCFKALSDHPDLAEAYQRQFRLIMVDEFQDTDRLQLAIIRMIAAPGMANVCTVGDVQQSIYRFRGADVNVFGEHRDALKADRSDLVEVQLPDNFRSHGDVLRLVDRLFSGPDMFGDSFLHLDPRGSINDEPDPTVDGHARAIIDIVHYNPHRKGSARTDDVRRANAERIAKHFADLHERGVAAHDMAILFGSMVHAQLYADALRAVGLDSMVTAGSTFSASEEVALVGALLRLARNRLDDSALLPVLISPLFAISDDVLLAMASRRNGEDIVRGDLAEGFMAESNGLSALLSDDDRTAVEMARNLVGRFVMRARSGDAEAALRDLLLQSGLLDRWQQQGTTGLAAAGNMDKACTLIGRLQRDAAGIASLSDAFDAHVASAKERPGLLAPNGGDFVTLITVHGSKGLEFSHVAIAELSFGNPGPSSFTVENIGGNTVVGCLMQPAGAHQDIHRKVMKFTTEPDGAASPANTPFEGFWSALESYRKRQEADERKRLLYVALTRAVRSVRLTALLPFDPEGGYEGRGIVEGLHGALAWPVDAASSTTIVPLGAGAQAEVHVERAEAMEAESEDEAQRTVADSEGTFDVPVRALPLMPHLIAGPIMSRESFSYTALSAHDAESHPPVGALDSGRGVATDLGTAFHRLAQRSIILADAHNATLPIIPEASDIDAQARSLGLSDVQTTRLRTACDRWFSSQEAQAFFACESKAAEVPFSVLVEDDVESFLLVGEIDGLACIGERALLIDYKTGGAPDEDADALFLKHLLQAQCYAYALLCSGFTEVDAHFIRVEQSCVDDPNEPQRVVYHFDASDREMLRHTICEAHRYAVAHA